MKEDTAIAIVPLIIYNDLIGCLLYLLLSPVWKLICLDLESVREVCLKELMFNIMMDKKEKSLARHDITKILHAAC